MLKTLEEKFDEKFVNKEGFHYSLNENATIAIIKSFIRTEFKALLKEVGEEIVPELKNPPHTTPAPDLRGWHYGWNDCRSKIKQRLETILKD